jgi:hypothetical protein
MAAAVDDIVTADRDCQCYESHTTKGLGMSHARMAEGHWSASVHDARRRGAMSPPGVFGEDGALVRTIGRAGMTQAYELGRAHPTPSTRPVLLVHGLGGTKSSWYFVERALAAEGLTVGAITYASLGSSVERIADRVAVEVERMLAKTGADKVHLIGHSLGGVVIAQAIASGRLAGKVDTVVTLGAPFGGSPWAHLVPFGAVVRALREGSPLLRRLASAPIPEGVRWLAITATLDVVVPGVRSVPAHTSVEPVTMGGVGHLGMLLSPHVVRRIVAALTVNPNEDNASSDRALLAQ